MLDLLFSILQTTLILMLQHGHWVDMFTLFSLVRSLYYIIAILFCVIKKRSGLVSTIIDFSKGYIGVLLYLMIISENTVMPINDIEVELITELGAFWIEDNAPFLSLMFCELALYFSLQWLLHPYRENDSINEHQLLIKKTGGTFGNILIYSPFFIIFLNRLASFLPTFQIDFLGMRSYILDIVSTLIIFSTYITLFSLKKTKSRVAIPIKKNRMDFTMNELKFVKCFIAIFLLLFTVLFQYQRYRTIDKAFICHTEYFVSRTDHIDHHDGFMSKNPHIHLTFGDSDIESISRLKYVRKIVLHSNLISHVAPFRNLPYLSDINLRNNQIINIDGFANLPQLLALDVSENFITDISNLAKLESLTCLDLSDNPINDIEPLLKLKRLKELGLANVATSDVSDLKISYFNSSKNYYDCIKIVEQAPIGTSDFSDLNRMTNLTHLKLNGNKLESIYMLSNLSNLIYLNLSYNNIADLSVLEELKDLNYLDISHNIDIEDISVIQSLPNLKTIILSECGRISADNAYLQNVESVKFIKCNEVHGQEQNDFVNGPIVYFVEHNNSHITDEMVYPAIALFPDGTFQFHVNLYEGMGTVYGSYEMEEDVYTFTVSHRNFFNFAGDSVEKFTMNLVSNRLTYMSEEIIGATSKGSMFFKSDIIPLSFARNSN